MHFKAEDGVLAALLRLTTTLKGASYFKKTLFISYVDTS